MTAGYLYRHGRWLLILIVLASVFCVLTWPGRAQAQGLQIRPLLYKQQLKPGEAKRGFVDVSNATHSPVTVTLKVRSFRQLDGQGTLEFYDSEATRNGVQLDLTDVGLGPSEAVRVYFRIDSSKLPAGDNFAAIFAATTDESGRGAAPSAQVGTLLLLENGAGGPHNAQVTKVSAPLISFGSVLRATAAVRNTGKPKQASAFFPRLTTSVGPWFGTSTTSQGPLVFGGITRTALIKVETRNMFGLFRLTVAANGGSSSRPVLLITGVWRWILLTLAVASAGFWYWSRRYRLELQWVASQRPHKPFMDWLGSVFSDESNPDSARESKAVTYHPKRGGQEDVSRQHSAEESKTPRDEQPREHKAVRTHNNPQITSMKSDAKKTSKFEKKTTKKHQAKLAKTKAKKTTKKQRKH